MNHREPLREEAEDERRAEPVQPDQNGVPADGPRRRHGASAWLEMMGSTSRDTIGKPEVMPNSRRSICVWAWKSSRRPPFALAGVTATSTASGFVTPSSVKSPSTRTVFSPTRLTDVETNSIAG